MSYKCSLCLQLLCRLLSSISFLNFCKEINVEKIETVCVGWIVQSETGLSVSLSLYPSRSFVLSASVSLCLAVYLSLCIMSLFLFFSFSLCLFVSTSATNQPRILLEPSLVHIPGRLSAPWYYYWIHTASNNTTTMLTTTFSSSPWLPKKLLTTFCSCQLSFSQRFA